MLSVKERTRLLANCVPHVCTARTMGRIYFTDTWTFCHVNGKWPWIHALPNTDPTAKPLPSDARCKTLDEVQSTGRKDMMPLKDCMKRSQVARSSHGRRDLCVGIMTPTVTSGSTWGDDATSKIWGTDD